MTFFLLNRSHTGVVKSIETIFLLLFYFSEKKHKILLELRSLITMFIMKMGTKFLDIN